MEVIYRELIGKPMVTRKLQHQNGSFFLVIPRALVDSIGANTGDSLSINLTNQNIVISKDAEK